MNHTFNRCRTNHKQNISWFIWLSYFGIFTCYSKKNWNIENKSILVCTVYTLHTCNMQLKIVFVTFVILLWKKIFVLQAFLNINDITYSISIGTLQLFPTPINIFSLDNLAIWINTMFEAKIHHFLCFFNASNERTSNRNSSNL